MVKMVQSDVRIPNIPNMLGCILGHLNKMKNDWNFKENFETILQLLLSVYLMLFIGKLTGY